MWRQWLKCDHTLRASSWPLPEGAVGVFLETGNLWLTFPKRDRWVSDLAHELRTPLTSIRLVVETLQEQLQPPAWWIDP